MMKQNQYNFHFIHHYDSILESILCQQYLRAKMAVLSGALKTLYSLLTLVMVAAFVYAFLADYFASFFDPYARWMQVGWINYFINICIIGAWYFYKESRRIKRVVFIFVIFFFGSVVTTGYIAALFFKLSPEESSKDPLYYVLARPKTRDDTRHSGGLSVVTTRVIFVTLFCFTLGVSVFVFIIYGSPFRAEVFTPGLNSLLVDLACHAVAYSVWVAYKESSWISALFWILLILCFGCIAFCAYLVKELFYLSPEQPVSLLLFNKRNRDFISSDPLLTEY